MVKKKKELSQSDVIFQGLMVVIILFYIFVLKDIFMFLILMLTAVAIKVALSEGYKITEMHLFIKDKSNNFSNPHKEVKK